MKKMITALAAIAIAIVAQSAQVNWKVTTGTTPGTVYSFYNTTTDAILAACTSTDATAWSTMFANAETGIVSGSGSRVATSGTNYDVAAGGSLVFVIVDGDIADGSTYTVYGAQTVPAANVYTPPSSGAALSYNVSNLSVSGTGTFTSVPEPTSGLLLLLGMAGLALKRKQA